MLKKIRSKNEVFFIKKKKKKVKKTTLLTIILIVTLFLKLLAALVKLPNAATAVPFRTWGKTRFTLKCKFNFLYCFSNKGKTL